MNRSLPLAALAAFGFAAAAAAQPSISVEPTRCLPVTGNGIVRAAGAGEAAGGSARLYFRWRGHDEFFWVEMEPAGAGRYWGVPPKPERRNEEVEYYGALLDAAGREVARSEPQTTRVTGDCRVELSPQEEGVAANLTIGETAQHQEGKPVLGFLCEGIVTRVNFQGIRRADEVCRACVVAWFERKAVLLPATGVTGVLIIDPEPEPSPSRP
jgi:hypothetical protein